MENKYIFKRWGKIHPYLLDFMYLRIFKKEQRQVPVFQ